MRYRLFIHKRKNISYILDDYFVGYKIDDKNISPIKINKIRRMMIKEIANYDFLDRKNTLIEYFTKNPFKEEILNFMKRYEYKKLFLTKKDNFISLHRGKKYNLIDENGKIESEKLLTHLYNNSFTHISLNFKQIKSLKKILTENEYAFITRYSDIEILRYTFPRPIGMPRMPAFKYFPMDEERYLPGFGTLGKDKKKELIKIEKIIEKVERKPIFSILNNKVVFDNLIISIPDISSLEYYKDKVIFSLKNNKIHSFKLEFNDFKKIKEVYLNNKVKVY